MPDHRRVRCRHCRGHRDDVGAISWRGLCGACGPKLSNENADALHTMTGPEVKRWRQGMAACVGGVLLDDLRESA